MKLLKEKYGLLVIGIVLGIAYGLVTRLVFGQKATLASVTYNSSRLLPVLPDFPT